MIRERKWLAGAVVVLLAAALVGLRHIASWDVWWHLAIGRESLRSGGTVPVDLWSYSFAGQPFVHKDLVGDIVLFGAYDALGFAGLALLRGLVVIVLSSALWIATPRASRDAVTWLAATLLLVVAVQSRIIPRPLMFTVAAFPVMLALLERARRHLSDLPRFVKAHLPILALQWLWLLLHRGGLLGLVLLLGHTLALALAFVLHTRPRWRGVAGPRPLPSVILASALLFGAAMLLGLLNPSGATLYTSAVAVSGDTIHRTGISEWAPLTWELARTVHPVASALIAMGLGLTIGRLGMALLDPQRPSPVHLWHLGVLVLFTVQGIASMRWLSYASGSAALVTALIGADWTLTRGTAFRPKGLMTILGFLGLGTLHLLNPSTVGLGEKPHRYPSGALAFADEAGLGADVHNAFVYGGYLLWHGDGERRVLIDGRNDMLYPSAFFARCAEAQRDPAVFRALQAEWPTDWVLAENTAGRESFTFLWHDPDWVPVYWSDPAIVWVRAAAHPALAAEAYRVLDPGHLVASLQAAIAVAPTRPDVAQRLEHELQRMLESAPESARPWTLAVLYFHARENEARRDEAFARLATLHPQHPMLPQLRAILDGGGGDDAAR